MKARLCVLFVALCLGAAGQTNCVVNGGFEDPLDFLAGWTWPYNVGGLLVSDTAAEGQNFASISGILCQDIQTTPGQVYELRYAMAGHPYYQGPTTLQVFWAGSAVATNTFDTTGHSNESLGWSYRTNYVLATAPNTRLGFRDLAQGIPYLDDVSAVGVDALPDTCVPPPPGMVSWWPGRGNALDIVGGNHGALLNGAGFQDGTVGQGFYLAGSNQCLQIGHNSSLATSNYTVEAWIKPLGPVIDPANQAVIFAQGNGHCQLLARPGTNGLLAALQFTAFPPATYDVVSSAEMPFDEFSHLAGTWDGAVLRLYLDGVLVAERAPGAAPMDSGCPFFIGGFYDPSPGICQPSGQFFNGIIDELSYYQRALTEEEIRSIFNARSLGKCRVPVPPSILSQAVDQTVYAGETVTFSVVAVGDTPMGYRWRWNDTNALYEYGSSLTMSNVQPARSGVYSVVVNNPAGMVVSSNVLLTVLPPPPCAAIPEGLVSWWRAENRLVDGWDDNPGEFVASGFGHPVIPVVGYVPGKVGQAFGFGTNCMLVADAPSLRVTNGLSIEGWVYPLSVSGSWPRTILAKFDPPTSLTPRTNSSCYFGLTNGHPYFVLSATGSGKTNAVLLAGSTVPAQRWSFVAATYDGAAMRLYLDGALVAEANYADGIFPGTADLGVGGIPWYPSSTYWPWSGYLDEISIYNRALSDAEIQGIYQADLTGKCPAPPQIIVQPESRAVPAGEDVLFSIGVVGCKPLRYEWRFKGQVIGGAYGRRLLLEKVNTNQVGDYSVLVTSTWGAALSSNATLTLLAPPNPAPLPPGLVSWWPGENSGLDVLGRNPVTPSPVYLQSFSTGKVGRAFNLSPTNVFYPVYSATNSATLNFGSNADFSVEAWVKVYPTQSEGIFPPTQIVTNQVILQKHVINVALFPGPGYALSVCRGRLACWLGSVAGRVTNSALMVSPAPDLRDSLFHHVAFTVQRDSTNGGNLYVDGERVLSFDASVFLRHALQQRSADFWRARRLQFG